MDILLSVMAFFALLGLIDDLIGGKLGISGQWNKGLAAMGPLALACVGFYCIGTTLIARNAEFITSLTRNMPFDPSLILGSLLCADSGGLPIALEVAQSAAIGVFTGALVGGGLGLTIGFQMPILMTTIDKKLIPSFMQGMGYGIIVLPVGLILGGILLNLSASTLLSNILPIFLLCLVLLISFRVCLKKAVGVLTTVAGGVRIISYVFFALVIIGLFVPRLAIAETKQVEEIMRTVLRTTIITSGGLVMSQLVIRYCQKPLSLMTRILKINDESAIGLLVSCVSGVAMLPLLPKMDRRGLVMNAAFSVCGSYILGGQMGFVSSYLASDVCAGVVPPNSMLAFLVNKLVCGLLAVLIAGIFVRPDTDR